MTVAVSAGRDAVGRAGIRRRRRRIRDAAAGQCVQRILVVCRRARAGEAVQGRGPARPPRRVHPAGRARPKASRACRRRAEIARQRILPRRHVDAGATQLLVRQRAVHRAACARSVMSAMRTGVRRGSTPSRRAISARELEPCAVGPELTQWYSPAGAAFRAAAASRARRPPRTSARSCGPRTPSARGAGPQRRQDRRDAALRGAGRRARGRTGSRRAAHTRAARRARTTRRAASTPRRRSADSARSVFGVRRRRLAVEDEVGAVVDQRRAVRLGGPRQRADPERVDCSAPRPDDPRRRRRR